jgi:rare lipoprotein A
MSSRAARYLKVVRPPVIVLTAVMLAACAQSSVVGNRNSQQPAFAANNRNSAGSSAEFDGLASYYTEGATTANGEAFDGHALTAAHRTLPFGTRVRVTNVSNGRSVIVRINDRGPFVPGRVVDVSFSAAETLGMTGAGVTKVKLEVVP